MDLFSTNASIGFGNGYGNVDTLPFFNNFYGGGIETLPGYAPNSLRPQNPLQTNAALGGNCDYSVVLILFSPI